MVICMDAEIAGIYFAWQERRVVALDSQGAIERTQ